jgi:hypothetical protein
VLVPTHAQLIADSLRHVIALKDAALQAAAARPVTINVPPQHITVAPTRDLFDGLSLIAALVIGPLVALGAALLGAKKGAEGARSAALEVQRNEAADARRLRLEERIEDERRARALLLRHFERDLVSVRGVADSLQLTRQFTPIMPMASGTLQAMWEFFLRRRDSVMLLASPEVEDEVEFFYGFVFSRATMLRTWLEDEEAMLSVGNPDAERIHARAAIGEADFRTHVARAERVLAAFRERVAQLGGTPSATPVGPPAAGPPPSEAI